MGLFNKKEKKLEEEIPYMLPELPKLPDLPDMNEREPLHRLPSFPNNPIGEKFSQNTIKEAVTGKKGGAEVFEADESEEEIQTMQKPQIKPSKRGFLSPEYEPSKNLDIIPKEFHGIVRETEPIFIRIDKFEEAIETFGKAKERISEIGKMLEDVKKMKEEEEKDLYSWGKEMQKIKEEIDKIDQNLFSKLR